MTLSTHVTRGDCRPRRFAFVSSNFSWGGSETLWSETAARLIATAHKVTIYKNRLPEAEGNVRQLRSGAVACTELANIPLLPRRLAMFLESYLPTGFRLYQGLRLYLGLKLRQRPDLIILSQGGNHDGWPLGAICRRLHLPYVLICQKATDLYWPQDRWLAELRAIYAGARHVFFVSEHNRRLTEEQLGQSIPNATVARNPFLVSWDAPQPWPNAADGYRLACVGRLYPKEKGQDLLLRVLAMPKWRDRPVSLTFVGSGEQRAGLEAMARFLELPNVSFAGQVDDVSQIWASHHALVLPSRAEGLPLVAVEAMLSGRVPVLTDVGGNAEIVEDGVSGFVADAATEAALDEALERAWARREEWAAIGFAAAQHARSLVPPDPAQALADQLLALADAGPVSDSKRANQLPRVAPEPN